MAVKYLQLHLLICKIAFDFGIIFHVVIARAANDTNRINAAPKWCGCHYTCE